MVGNPEAMRVAERFTHAIVSLDVDAVGYRPNIVVRRSATEVESGTEVQVWVGCHLGFEALSNRASAAVRLSGPTTSCGHCPVRPRQP